MVGFLMFMVQIALNTLTAFLNAIQWDIGNSSLRGEVPVTVVALGGALLGALVAGFFGAILGGVVAVVLYEIYKGKQAVGCRN